jgi:4-hydroxy-4-methyl-2-oxoglutarate aldolase
MTYATRELSDEDRRELIALGASTLGESGATALSPRIRPVWKGAAFAAPAFTAACAPGDNLAMHAALAAARPGMALVAACPGDSVRGYWGEVMTIAAEVAGIVALVIDGQVRDVAAIEQHGFPVFATGVALRGAAKTGPGSLQVPIALGDAIINPGDWLVGDTDGVVVIRQEDLTDCRAAGAARASKEADIFERLRAGATTADVLSLDLSAIENA